MTTILLWITAWILVLVGILGVVVPVLPGVPLAYLGFLLGAWIDGFQKVGWVTLFVLGALTAVSIVVDWFTTALGARKMGASRTAMAGAVAGIAVGMFFGLLGLIAGPFIGAAAGEYYARKDVLQAGKAGLGTWLGLIIGTAGKLTLAVAMLVIFIMAYFM